MRRQRPHLKTPAWRAATSLRTMVIAGVAACALVAVSTSAAAAPSPSASRSADGIAAQVNRVAPTLSQKRLATSRDSAGISAAAAGLSVRITGLSTGRVELTRGTGAARRHLAIGLPAGRTTPAQLATDGTVTYREALPHVDLAVQAFATGVRIQTVLQSAQAATEFSYPVDVPKGGRLVKTSDGGVLVYDRGGISRGALMPPWARDANGRDVPTHYELRGTTVVQQVAHHRTGIRYPVVADPYGGINLIDSAAWVWQSEGWSMHVTPSWWARAQGTQAADSFIVGIYGWDELYSNYPGLTTNLTSMMNQYICHQQFAFFKATWNLDEWRPDVGYAQTVARGCNP